MFYKESTQLDHQVKIEIIFGPVEPPDTLHNFFLEDIYYLLVSSNAREKQDIYHKTTNIIF